MITVDVWCAGGMGGVRKWGDECSVSGADGERLLSKLSPTLTEGAVTTEAWSLFQYFTTLNLVCIPEPRAWLASFPLLELSIYQAFILFRVP